MRQPFGTTSDGREAGLYILRNVNGTQAEVTDYGATLVRFIFRDKSGIPRDLVLGYDDASGYEKGDSFFGTTVGRFANRIGEGRFSIGEKVYELTLNDGPNTLHSGRDFYGKRFWDVKEATDTSVTFRLFSPDGDQGFPGNLSITVTYTLSEDDELAIDYWAESDGDTPLNLTNHSYFNLAGHAGGNILSQIAFIHAGQITEPDQNLIPNGRLVSVEDTPMDFRKGKALGRDISEDYYLLETGHGYDHNYVLSGSGCREAASLYCPETGIRMTVRTDLPGMQVYTANFLDQEPGKEGAVYCSRDAVCFETQFFPDAVNKESFPGGLIKAGEVFRSRTSYSFSLNMKDFIAYCGLDCESCEARLATASNDDSLRRKVAKLWSELNGVEITPEMINCSGCRIEGVKTPYCDSLCPIRQCALGKGVRTCGDCSEMDTCGDLSMITGSNAAALRNLKEKSK